MEIGKVERYINDKTASGKGAFMGLIDPDKQAPEKALQLARNLEAGGADVIMLGGSIGVQGPVLEHTAKLIKNAVKLPLHIFPGNVGNVTYYADSIYFMSLLNSKNAYWITGAQTLGAPVIKHSKIEPIPTAYLVFEPGETVGRVGDANLLPRDKPDLAVAYSLAAQYLGMRFVILESGSGAPEPVPTEIVKAVRHATGLKIVVAGGVKTPEQARELVKAGANCIHIGTKIEDGNVERIRAFSRAIHMEEE
ncbi:MAG: geranylgeranylglyceryl/heptaprenylglyceryl phosphate synthase [Candidatus Aenigmarchaeota archaeon]|nr:geranylgeranylglyceryl/heptaprenylglyceryl phosphate synthase [Candidatus Aenigmarchaeota archaeon]